MQREEEIELMTDTRKNLPFCSGYLVLPLQPIVENAYLHAFSGNINDGWILDKHGPGGRVGDGNGICIEITDNGMGMEGG